MAASPGTEKLKAARAASRPFQGPEPPAGSLQAGQPRCAPGERSVRSVRAARKLVQGLGSAGLGSARKFSLGKSWR